MVDGVQLTLSTDSIKGTETVNPFTLKERYKPLAASSLTKKFTRTALIKLLVNGQFKQLKQCYKFTDDYALDAANRFSKQMLGNPLTVARGWISDRYKSEFAYCHNGHVSFGSHSNDCSQLTICLDNRLPAVNVDTDIANALGVDYGTAFLVA
jgi:hypothetical protein